MDTRVEAAWENFVGSRRRAGKASRVQWNKFESRFFKTTCQGISLATGQALNGNDCRVDGAFNADGYARGNCILIERGLDFAKRDMPDFQSSRGLLAIARCNTEFSDFEKPAIVLAVDTFLIEQ